MATRRSDNTFRGARNISLGRIARGVLGQSDRVDFYKFRASGQVNFNLALSGLQAPARVRLLNSRRAPIAVSNQPGNRAERISATLDGGLYYIQVQFLGRRGTTRYNLRTSATPTPFPTPTPAPTPTPIGDQTLATAVDLGVLTTTIIRSDFVGTEDSVDFYRFTLNDVANLQVRATSPTAATRVELIRDGNGNGLVDSGEILASDRDFSRTNAVSDITQDLPPGTYFLKIEPASSGTSTQYQLDFVPTLFNGSIAPEPGNTLPVAFDRGILSGTFTARDYVGTIDSTDNYRFTLDDLANVQISVRGSSAATRVRLIRDSNNNGLIDNDEILASATNFTSPPVLSSITQDLPSGTYFVNIEPRDTSISTLYEMNLVVTPFGGNISPDPGNTLPSARDLGAFSGTFSAREYVGFLDSDDFYRITLNSATNLQVRATGSSAATRIQLIQDNNNNGLIDNNETLASATNFTSPPVLSEIRRDVQAGTYFIRVSPRDNSLTTNYSLSLVTG